MGLSIRKTVCPFCRSIVEEAYNYSTWKRTGACMRCGSKWEKQYDEYDLSNMRVTRGYGSVFAMIENEIVGLKHLYERPTQKEVDGLLGQLAKTYAQADSRIVVFEREDGEWIEKISEGKNESVFVDEK